MAENGKTEEPTVPDLAENVIPAVASPENRRRNKYAFACAILASMAPIILGYDVGVMSGAVLFIKENLKIDDTKVEILVGILNLYSLFGSLAAGRTSDWIGRRYTLVFAAVFFFVGALLMGLAPNYAFLMVGRFFTGIGVGCGGIMALVYTAEIAPTSARGFLTSFPEIFINAGILLGYVSNFAFSGLPVHLSWRLMLGVGGIPPVFLAFGILTMPESPRWLVMQGRLGEAKRVLMKISISNEEAAHRLSDIKAAAGIPDNCTDEVVAVPKKCHGEGVWRELLFHPIPSVRRVLISAVGIHFFQQASGIDSVVLYSPRVFEKAGIKKKRDLLAATVAVGFTKTCFILVATFLLDRLGRRPLLLTSVAGMFVSLAGLGFGLTVVEHSDERVVWAIAICIATILSYVAFFSIGLGPITLVYSTEIFPLRLRAQGTSMGVAVNRITSGVITMTFISLYKAVSIGGAFFLFAGIASVGWLFFYFYLRETKGKSLEEMEVLFGKGSNPSSVNKKEIELGNDAVNH